MKVLFLDFDGPMIPSRAYLLPASETMNGEAMDPIAVAMVNRLLRVAPAQLVISSSWRSQGRDIIVKVLQDNGVDTGLLHKDWRTGATVPEGTRFGDAESGAAFAAIRGHQIATWLAAHPEVTEWVVFDDDPVVLNGVVQCTFDDGLTMANFRQAATLLGIPARQLFQRLALLAREDEA